MCIAIPAKIVELDAVMGTAKASVAGNLLEVNIRLVSARVGDYVLVHAGCAVEVLQRDCAEDILSCISELEEFRNDS